MSRAREENVANGLLPAGVFAGWDLHPLESAALSRRTPEAVINRT